MCAERGPTSATRDRPQRLHPQQAAAGDAGDADVEAAHARHVLEDADVGK